MLSSWKRSRGPRCLICENLTLMQLQEWGGGGVGGQQWTLADPVRRFLCPRRRRPQLWVAPCVGYAGDEYHRIVVVGSRACGVALIVPSTRHRCARDGIYISSEVARIAPADGHRTRKSRRAVLIPTTSLPHLFCDTLHRGRMETQAMMLPRVRDTIVVQHQYRWEEGRYTRSSYQNHHA